MAALSEPILTLIYGAKDGSAHMAAPLLSILAVSSFLVSMLAMTNSILQAAKKQNYPLISMLIGASVKVVASYILIGNEKIGIYGAPISTDICYILVMLMNFYFCARHADFRPNILKIFGKPLIAAACCGIGALLSYGLFIRLIDAQRLCTLLAIGVAILIYLAVILLTGALSREEFAFIPKGEKIYALLHRARLVK